MYVYLHIEIAVLYTWRETGDRYLRCIMITTTRQTCADARRKTQTSPVNQ